jgi:hypothetical protein
MSQNKDYQAHERERDESQSVFQGTVPQRIDHIIHQQRESGDDANPKPAGEQTRAENLMQKMGTPGCARKS